MGQLDRLESACRLADDREFRLFADQRRDGPPEQGLVIDEQDSDRT